MLGLILAVVFTALYMWFFGINVITDRDGDRTWQLKGKLSIAISLVIFVFFLFMPIPIAVVPTGYEGVLTMFGKPYGQISQGLNLVNPLAKVSLMSVRTQEQFEHEVSPSKEGLAITMEVSMLYHIDQKMAKELFQDVGPDYKNVVVMPTLRSGIRGATVKHDAKDLYTSNRELIADQIQADVVPDLFKRGIVVEKILLRKIDLPTTVTNAIDAKLAADQQSQQMVFVLAKERQEAERKRIEAKGIQDFQKIVSEGISDQLLKWKGIEATEKLSLSGNAKMVIIGGKDGLPLILNSGK